MGEVKHAIVSVSFDETFYEEMLIQYFTKNLGYEYLYGPEWGTRVAGIKTSFSLGPQEESLPNKPRASSQCH